LHIRRDNNGGQVKKTGFKPNRTDKAIFHADGAF
jgi:hypothetical protein